MCRINAKAVYQFYKITGKKHLIITGERGCGKTTLVNALIEHIKSYGLEKLTSCKQGDYVYMKSSYNNEQYVIGRLKSEKASETTNRMELVKEGFLKAGVPAIQHYISNCRSNKSVHYNADYKSDKSSFITDNYSKYNDCTYMVIDELGYLESRCDEFTSSVIQLFDNDNSKVIAVLRKQHTPFFDELLSRDDVCVIDIDECFNNLGCIIMASGLSKRFGSNKLFAEYKGILLIENAINIAKSSLIKHICTVTRYENAVKISNDHSIDSVLHNKEYRNEVIDTGMNYILKYNPDGIMFVMADQPLISEVSMQLLALCFEYYKDKICRLSYDDVVGSPVIFPAHFYNELCNLPPKKGGGYIIKKYPEQVINVPAQDIDELSDIDTQQDLIRLSIC